MEYCAVVNSHESYHDALKIFLKCFRQKTDNIPLYVCTNTKDGIELTDNEILVEYSGKTFSEQGLYSLKNIPFQYILTFNDDYFVTDTPAYSEIDRCIEVLKMSNFSQIRFVRGPNFSAFSGFDRLFKLDNSKPFFFSQTLSLWKRDDLIQVYENTPKSGIARKGNEEQFEVLANRTCARLGLEGLVYYNDEPKEGYFHYECSIMPHLISAIVDGKWNMSEYKIKLEEIFEEFAISTDRTKGPSNKNVQRLFLYLNSLPQVKNAINKRLKR
ncbi:MAG: hypothetical protein HWE23_02430 [Rhodobacteraceae bacterium]|nr:hypothetical protein [Paracoccaceae bacterium]